jgi:hypothetical protein
MGWDSWIKKELAVELYETNTINIVINICSSSCRSDN